jgi:hypothetical protein
MSDRDAFALEPLQQGLHRRRVASSVRTPRRRWSVLDKQTFFGTRGTRGQGRVSGAFVFAMPWSTGASWPCRSRNHWPPQLGTRESGLGAIAQVWAQ